MKEYVQKAKILGLLFLTLSLIVTLSLSAHSGLANAQNKTSMQSQGTPSMATTTNATNMNIVLVHGTSIDGSS
jgi:hypothetical protein